MLRPKKSKTPSQPVNVNFEQRELWHRHFDALSSDDREIIEHETRKATAACGSRLAVAKHLSNVRSVLCRDLSNPKQKHQWTLYLKVNLPGLASSRTQAFRDIKAWQAAEERFPPCLLEEFLSSGYALAVRPTVDEPIGKYTKPLQQILAKLGPGELNAKECEAVLLESAAIIKAEAKRNRPGKATLSVEERRERILADIHNSVIARIVDLSSAVEPGDSYTSTRVRDDLELIVSRLMTAIGVDALEAEPRSLPEGFEPLSLSSLEVAASEETSDEAAFVVTAA